ncbi:TPA: hypothetical protein N0F65_011895 [Lagenidium giganteum]|uniref:Nucleosome assembly protein n=1 Tax=Lagenidium giganteum TaxID=4803 RepID=A0AAV2YKA3_9STRA|nr:TPA: hypothetical protein N0F65_011895 [Lagenidium giganteum]
MADQQPAHIVEDETVVEVDAADGRGFQPVDDVAAKMGAMGLDHDEDDEEDDLANLPRKVQLRIEALRKLQESQAELEEQFEKERRLLELKYEKLYQPMYRERAEIVAGSKEVDAVLSGEGLQQEEASAEEDDVKGIPGFWLRALMNHSLLEELIHERDLPAFEYLVDIRSSSHEDDNGFKLEFEFAPNPFFENTVLTKEYDVAEASDAGDAVLRNITGTEIQWKAGQNLCEVTKKVKQRAKGSKETRVIQRTEPCESFFQIFTPVEMPSEEEEDEDSRMLMRQLTRDFQIGFTIHESIVPQAVLWFTGEAVEADSDYDPEEDEDFEEDEESDSDEEEGAPRRGKNKKFAALGEAGAASTEKPPECKNQ